MRVVFGLFAVTLQTIHLPENFSEEQKASCETFFQQAYAAAVEAGITKPSKNWDDFEKLLLFAEEQRRKSNPVEFNVLATLLYYCLPLDTHFDKVRDCISTGGKNLYRMLALALSPDKTQKFDEERRFICTEVFKLVNGANAGDPGS